MNNNLDCLCNCGYIYLFVEKFVKLFFHTQKKIMKNWPLGGWGLPKISVFWQLPNSVVGKYCQVGHWSNVLAKDAYKRYEQNIPGHSLHFVMCVCIFVHLCVYQLVWNPVVRIGRPHLERKSRLVSLHWPLASSAIGQSAKRGFSLVRTPVVRGGWAVIGQDIGGQRDMGILLVRTSVVIGWGQLGWPIGQEPLRSKGLHW